MNIKKAKRYHKNPRVIKSEAFDDLKKWLAEYGDLSGIVLNLESGEVICGNMRFKALDIKSGEIKYSAKYDEPTKAGTVAVGHITIDGEQYSYREVRWTPEQEARACIIANKAGGSWDWDILANEWESQDLLNLGFQDFELYNDKMTVEDSDEAEENFDAGTGGPKEGVGIIQVFDHTLEVSGRIFDTGKSCTRAIKAVEEKDLKKINRDLIKGFVGVLKETLDNYGYKPVPRKK